MLVKTVSNFTLSALVVIIASLLVMKESFLQALNTKTRQIANSKYCNGCFVFVLIEKAIIKSTCIFLLLFRMLTAMLFIPYAYLRNCQANSYFDAKHKVAMLN